ncbi:sporulation stage IV protein A [Anaerotignum neopropionicum]
MFCMPEDAQIKMAEILQRMVDEGKDGLICMIL